jgi:hypothetical protein
MTQNNNDLHEVEDPDVENYEPKPEGEKQFWKRHLIKKYADRNGNNDAAFNGGVKKDKTRQPADPKADLENPTVGNRPVDQLKGEKIKESSIIQTMRNKVINFKERYGDNWKNVMGSNEETEVVSEDSQAATSDSPGGAQPVTGTVDNNNSHLNNNPTGDAPKKGDVKNTLEAIAMQAAELHDKLEDGQEIDSQAQAMLSEAKDALDQVYEIITNGGGAQDAKPAPAPKNGGASANVKEDFDAADDSFEVLDEATVKDKTGTIVGTHKAGEGFKPNALGKKLGHKAHPTDVPSDTTITKRGRKVGSKSFGASKRKGESSDESGGPSEKPSFTDQLLKAADNREGGHVEFDNGQKHHVPRAHANAGLYHLGKPEKPADKNKVRKHIGASKENFDSFRKSGGQLPKEAPKYDPDAKIKARTAQITSGRNQTPRANKHTVLAQKILARRRSAK